MKPEAVIALIASAGIIAFLASDDEDHSTGDSNGRLRELARVNPVSVIMTPIPVTDSGDDFQ